MVIKLRTLYLNNRRNILLSGITLVAVVIVGSILVLTKAAGLVVSSEPESGTRSSNASIVSDSSASGSQAVKFSAPSVITCNLNATTANFAAQVTAASAGQTICLATGNYGTWAGVNKAITITAASGASPTMKFAFAAGDNGFTLDHIGGLGGTIANATNVTIQNGTFTSTIDIDGASTSNIMISHNDFLWPAASGGYNAKIVLNESVTPTNATVASPAVTVQYNDIQNGDLDGVHIGGGAGLIVKNNYFKNLCDANANHTDNIQFEGGREVLISGNLIYAPQSCNTQGITSFDSGTNGIIIENNVVDIPRDWEIELYSDKNSIVRHNTIVWRAAPYSGFGHATGIIDFENKSGDPAGSGTHAYDNVAFISVVAPTTVTSDHNTNPSTVTFVGGVNATTHDGFLLTAGSAGHLAASDGTDTGIYAIGNVTYGPLP